MPQLILLLDGHVVLKCAACDDECLGAWVNLSNLVSQGRYNSKSRANNIKSVQKSSMCLVFLGEDMLDTFNAEHPYNLPARTAALGLSLQVG